MRKMNKILAGILASALVLGTSAVAFATPGDTDPKDETSGTTTPEKPSEDDADNKDETGKGDVTEGEDTKIELGEKAPIKELHINVPDDAFDLEEGDTLEFIVESFKDTKKGLTAAVGTIADEKKAAVIEAAIAEIDELVAADKAVVIDLSFLVNGAVKQPDGTVKVTIGVPDFLAELDTVFVYHVGNADIELIAEAEVDAAGNITFATSEFSPFVLSGEALEALEEEEEPADSSDVSDDDSSDDNGDENPSTGIALAIAPVVLAAGAVAIIGSKKK